MYNSFNLFLSSISWIILITLIGAADITIVSNFYVHCDIDNYVDILPPYFSNLALHRNIYTSVPESMLPNHITCAEILAD